MKILVLVKVISISAILVHSGIVSANSSPQDCQHLPSYNELRTALRNSVAPNVSNGGFDLNMWATIVNRDGRVCEVTMSGNDRGDQWPGSRVISAQKANTANAFSLPGLSLATANLFSAVQPGASLYGLQHSNPVDPAVAYGGHRYNGQASKFGVNRALSGGSASAYGTSADPMGSQFIGGVNVFGGGLALYDANGVLLGALGVSGDSSCADHNIAWRVRAALELDNVPGGVSSGGASDQIIYDIDIDGVSASGFGHPLCGGNEQTVGEEIGAVQ